MSLISYKHDQDSVILRVKIYDSSVTTGAGKTGLSFSSSGLRISTIADVEASPTGYTAAGSTIEDITTLGTYAAPTSGKCRFKQVHSTNHPGVYEIQLADARFSVASAKSLLVSISGATDAAECDVLIPLTQTDPYDAVRGGMTALPNAAADAAGGLPISDGGGLDLDAILADTNELQTDWTDGGRLDLILDARASQSSVNTIDGIVDAILIDTAEIGVAGAGLTTLVDLIYEEPYADHTTAGTFGKIYDLVRKSNLSTEGTVAASPTPTTTAFGSSLTDSDDTWNEQVILFTTGTLAGQTSVISDFANTNGLVTVSEAFSAAPTAADEFVILPQHVHTLASIRNEIDTNSTQLAAIKGVTDVIPDSGAMTSIATAAALATVDAVVDGIQADLSNGTDGLGALKTLIDAIPTDPGGIKKNTALANFTFLMVDATDFATPETGLTVTAERSLDGAAFAACANAVTEISAGHYKIDLAASDLNGDTVILKFTATGAAQRSISIVTEP